MYVPGAIIAVLFHNKYSLRSGVVIGALLQSFGAFVMTLTFAHYSFVYLGDAIICIVHQTIVFSAPLLAVKWFEDSKRVLAISLAVTVAYIGTGESYGLNTFIIDSIQDMKYSPQTSLITLFAIKAAFSTIVSIIAYFTFRSKPRRPPSEAATVHRDDDILGTIRLLYTNKQFMLLTFTHILYMTSFEILRKNSRRILLNEKHSDSQIKDFEIVRILSGIFGSLVLAIFLYYKKLYKIANI